MARFQLPDGSHICQWPEGPGAFFSHTSQELEEIVRNLRANAEDPVGMAALRGLLAAEHDELAVREMGDEAVLFEVGGHIKSGRLLWSAGVLAAKGGGGGGKKEEPKPPPPPPKPKDEVVVTPFLEVEMRVVLFDRGLEKHLSDPKYPAQPTWIRLAMRQSPHEPKFKKGGKLKVEGAGAVEAYEDEKLTKKFDISAPIPIDKLTKSDPLTLWLKGKTKGKFELKFEVDGAAAPFKADKPATAKMGVVEVQFKLHDQNLDEIKKVQVDPDADTYHNDLKAKALPDQKELSDEDKIKKGRFLHVQDAGHHGRAKLVLKKLVASEWPDGVDDYELVLTPSESADAKKTNTALDALDKETEGASKNTVTVAAAKAADVTLWVEGKTASKKLLDTRLDLGVGGEGKKKRNGDWARFTIVKIKDVTILASSESKKAQIWDSVKKRFYINTAASPGGRELKDDPGAGKKVKIKARLTEKIKDVQIHFMLAGHKENIDAAKWTTNFKYGKLDKKLKAVDKKDRKDVIHLFAATDGEGAAEMKDLVLSRLGGEKYKIGVYIAQDPHLAKYVDGHADLGKRKPVLGDEFQVWRRTWAQLTYNKTLALDTRATVVTEYEALFIEYKEVDEKKFDKTSIAGLVEHPKWQFNGGTDEGKIICVGDHNKTKFHGLYKAPSVDHTPKSHLIICDVQWDPETTGVMRYDATSNPFTHRSYDSDASSRKMGIVTPTLTGVSLLVAGSWTWNDGATIHVGTISAADISIVKGRAHFGDYVLKLPAQCPATCPGPRTAIAPSVAKPAKIVLQLNGAKGPWNGESGTPHCLIRYRVGFFSTINHEIGHQYNQVREIKSWLGVPNHPDQYIRHGGQGSHCRKGATVSTTDKDKDGNWFYDDGTCWMYHAGTPSRVSWCDNCKTDLRVRDLSDFAIDT